MTGNINSQISKAKEELWVTQVKQISKEDIEDARTSKTSKIMIEKYIAGYRFANIPKQFGVPTI
jgi:hypothetical protein